MPSPPPLEPAPRPDAQNLAPARKTAGPSRGLILAAAGAMLALLIAGILIPRVHMPSAGSLIGGPFALQSTQGGVLTENDMKGQPFLVFFGYTNCPDICPTTLAEISNVLARLPGKPLRALFITIDPERDDVATLKEYLSSFDARILGLTGSLDAIEQAKKSYRVYAKKAPSADGGYTMDHFSMVYLMDAKGAFVEAFDLDRKAEEAARELAAYL